MMPCSMPDSSLFERQCEYHGRDQALRTCQCGFYARLECAIATMKAGACLSYQMGGGDCEESHPFGGLSVEEWRRYLSQY